ncbi:OmpA family protein [Candidatus Dependentiae bacterium]
MKIKKYIVLFSLALVFLIPACSKKSKEKTCPIVLNEVESKQQILASSEVESDQQILAGSGSEYEIPVVKEEEEAFFDEDNISEFAFIDDDFSENKEESQELVYEQNVEVSQEVASNTSEDVVAFSQALDADENVAWKEEEEVLFKSVYFDINKNSIKDDQVDVLQENIEKARDAVENGKNIIIQGHACQFGSPAYNMPLSERRANIIKKEMVKNGISEDKIKIIGCGQEMPVVWSDNPVKTERVKELAQNRRSEILIG